MSYSVEIKGHCLEFIDATHQYLVDGIIVPSVTEILNIKFDQTYKDVPKGILEAAALKGTQMHEDIERYCVTGQATASKEIGGFKFLQKMYKFEVIENEVPIIIFRNEEPIAAGRLDAVIKMNDKLGIADFKRTYLLHKERLAYQLNLYRIGYQQSYDKQIEFLRGIHLRDDIRKFVPIPINEELTEELICLI